MLNAVLKTKTRYELFRISLTYISISYAKSRIGRRKLKTDKTSLSRNKYLLWLRSTNFQAEIIYLNRHDNDYNRSFLDWLNFHSATMWVLTSGWDNNSLKVCYVCRQRIIEMRWQVLLSIPLQWMQWYCTVQTNLRTRKYSAHCIPLSPPSYKIENNYW